MSVGRTKRSLINVVVSIGCRIIVMILPFILRMVMIQELGTEYLGLDSLFSSILNMLSLSELGFSSAVVYSMYKPMAENDIEKIGALLGFYKKIYRIVGMVILVFGLILLPFLKYMIAADYPNGINIYIIYIAMLLNTVISYGMYAYLNALLIASMRNDIDSILEMIRSVFQNLFQIILLVAFRNYYLYIVVFPMMTILNNIMRMLYVKKRFPQYNEKIKLPNEDKSIIWDKVKALIGHKLGGMVFTSVDSMVISSFLGLIMLGKYTNYYTLFTAVYGMLTVAFTSIQSVLGNNMVCNSENDNYLVFKELFFVNGLLTCICTCCFAFIYQPFIELWVGKSNVLEFYIPLLLSIYFFVKSSRRICYSYKEAAGLWSEDFWKPYVSVIVNLVTNIILVSKIGVAGVVISSIIAILFVEIPWETYVLFKTYFKRSCMEYVLKNIKLVLITAISMMLCFIVCENVSGGFIGIIIRGVICVFIPLATYLLLCFKSPELIKLCKRFTTKNN